MILIRDPLWDTIRLDEAAERIVDSRSFQRLRYIRQLGLAHLVYPGASHTRFDHALGVYHLAKRAIELLSQTPAIHQVSPDDVDIIPYAGLLHDIGHYPFSHAVEELEHDRIPGDHEELVGHFLSDEDVRAALAPNALQKVEELVRGMSANPLQGLVSGSLDLDKIDYLKRDAYFCGVPYGEVDVDRLLHSLTIVRDPVSGLLEIGVHEKGVASLESLLFAKYQMFRNVYWHHAVRAATVMYKRIVGDALDCKLVQRDELIGQTDEGFLYMIEARTANSDDARRVQQQVSMLRNRVLPKRAIEVPAADIGEVPDWLAFDSPVKRKLEESVAEKIGAEPGSVYIDYPEKKAMFGLNILVQRRSGEVIRMGPGGWSGLMGLPQVADELYNTARMLRVFISGAHEPLELPQLTFLLSGASSM